jgi:hypothetical protein
MRILRRRGYLWVAGASLASVGCRRWLGGDARGCARTGTYTCEPDPPCGVTPSTPPGPEGSKGPRALSGVRGVLVCPLALSYSRLL